jgi:hypothetical protein
LGWIFFLNSASEAYPEGHKALGTTHNWNPIVHNTDLSSWRGHPILQYLSWYRVIQTYNIRDITYPTDKLPALAGLAKAFKEMMKNNSMENEYEEDNYLAGLWSRDLTSGLIWSAYCS